LIFTELAFVLFFFTFLSIRSSKSYVHGRRVDKLTQVDLNSFISLFIFSYVSFLNIFLLKILLRCFMGLLSMWPVSASWPQSRVLKVNTSWFWSFLHFFFIFILQYFFFRVGIYAFFLTFFLWSYLNHVLMVTRLVD
jgi:hypothetical protein